MRRIQVRRQVAVLLLGGAAALLLINSIGSRQQWEEATDAAAFPGVPGGFITARKARPPVMRNALPTGDDALEAILQTMLVSDDEVLEEAFPGSEVWRASAWNDTQFEPSDMAMLKGLMTWLRSPTGGCDRLEMMGRPRRTGNGVRAEQPVCKDEPTVAGALRLPCIVYLLGVGSDWALAEQLARDGCFVFVLDHREVVEPEGEHSYHVRFRRLGVGRNAHDEAGGQVLTLDGLFRELDHRQRQLHLLRADLGGLETDMLLDQLVDSKSRYDRRCALDRADQLSLRLHLRNHVEKELTFYRQLWQALQQLELLGFELVHSAPFEAGGQWQFPGTEEPVVLIYDVLLVRKRPAARGFDPNMVD